jgi:ABC-2 type transport system ATP-binding protein
MSRTVAGGPIPHAIKVENLGIRFFRSRRRRASLRDQLFRPGQVPKSEQFWGVRNVSFTIQPGEAVGIVGANGQGKSTLLKLVAGVLLPDEGSVEVLDGVAPLIEVTGGFVGDLTVRDNIFLTGQLHGLSKSEVEARFDEIVDFAEIGDFLDMKYRHLSSGMKVRVGFSVITQLDEPIVLVDEVTAVGDRRFKKKARQRLEELFSSGRTLFLVSHSEANLQKFCTRGLFLQKGRLVLDGTIDEALDAYAASIGEQRVRVPDLDEDDADDTFE